MKTIQTVLLLPINYDHVQYGMIDGFFHAFGSQNVNVFDFMCAAERPLAAPTRTPEQVNQDLVEYIGQRKPDLVFMQLQDTDVITAEAIAAARAASPATVFAHWTGDYRPTLSTYVQSICQATDLTFASSTGQGADFIEAGAPVFAYLQIGLDWEEDVLGIPAWEPPFPVPEVVFCGNHYASGPWAIGTEERLEALRAVKAAGFDLGVVGTGWPDDIPVVGTCTVKQQTHVYRRAKVALAISHENAVENYHSDRLLIAMASGTPVVSKFFPGLGNAYGNAFVKDRPLGSTELIPFFRTTDELVDLLAELKANEYWRVMLGRDQRAEARANHSWFSRVVSDILPAVEELP